MLATRHQIESSFRSPYERVYKIRYNTLNVLVPSVEYRIYMVHYNVSEYMG